MDSYVKTIAVLRGKLSMLRDTNGRPNLADECGRLAHRLKRKRVHCDLLRDRIDELERGK